MFILKSCQLGQETSTGRVVDDPTLTAPSRASHRMFGGAQIHHDDNLPFDEAPFPAEDQDPQATSSTGGYGSSASRVPMVNVTVNVTNNVAPAGAFATPRQSSGSDGESGFEFVTP